jgi:hypothetical protein
VRPVLVRESKVLEDPWTGIQFGAVVISYASGEFNKSTDGHRDLIIDDRAEVRALGLHKATRFSLNPNDKKQLPWCEEYFVPQGYVRAQNVVAGLLTAEQIARLRACLTVRGLG